MKSLVKFFAVSAFTLTFMASVLIPGKASASLAGFDPGNIMSDYVMADKNTMSASAIQNYLNLKVSNCTTNQIRGYTNESRAIAPCLKDYNENGQTAAQIIWQASQDYSINPQVLIVLLQKEQGLITDTWPRDGWWWTKTNLGSPVKECTDPSTGQPRYCVNVQYRSATGYGCPDTAPCAEQYFGFTNQVRKAAALFREVLNGGWSNYPVGVNYVQYNPNAGCGGSNINIQNRATSALYRYTPYQPNSAALAAGWGEAASCGAYGNRNFYNYFTDWFGPSNSILSGISMTNIQQPNANPARGETLTYTYSLTNNLNIPITFDAVGVVGRLGSVTGQNRDFGWRGPVTIQPGTSQEFTFSALVNDIGTIFAWPAVNYQGSYTHYNNWGITIVSHTPNFTLSQPLTITPSTVYAGQNVTFSAKLKNNEPRSINYDAIGIPVKFYDRYSYDAVWVGPGVIAPGAEITLSGMRNIDKPGPFTYWVSHNVGGAYTTIGPVNKFSSSEANPNFSVSGLSFNNTSPAQGENITASFTVTNNLPVPITVDGVGVVGRFGTFSGPNRDIGWQGPITFAAGETKPFSGYSRAITDVGTHYYWIGVFDNNSFIQYNNWGSTVVSRAPNFSVSGITFNNTSPAQGENITASFTVTNNLPVPITVDGVGVVGRFGTFSGPNRDIGWQGPITFAAGETKPFSGYSRAITDVGTHYYWIGVFDNNSFIQYNNWGSTVVSH